MVVSSIKINGTANSVDSLSLSVPVSLSNNDNTGVISWTWSFLSKPPGSAATLSTPNAPTSSFTPDLVGSYLIQLEVFGTSDSSTDSKIGAVKTAVLGMRIPAGKEKKQFDATNGWMGALYADFKSIDDNIEKIKNSTLDTTPGFLTNKIVTTSGISSSTLNTGANEQLQLSPTYGTASSTICQGNDSRLSDSRNPLSHASSHKNGGGDEVSTATPTANAIPKADSSGKLDTSWIYDASASVKGKIQLSTDLGNSASAPQVIGLQGNTLPSTTANGFLKRNSGNTTWEEVIYGTASNTVCQGSDSRLSDSRTPTAHATSHKSGQSDAIKLDELAAPTDVTTLDVSISAHGLTPKLPNDSSKYLNGIGAYTVPAGGGGSDGYNVKVTSSDTTPDFLQSKIVAGSNVTLAILNPGANEQLRISSAGLGGGADGYNAKVTITDTTPDFLNSKIVVTNGLQKAVIGVGNEQLQLQPSYGSSANTVCQGNDSRLTKVLAGGDDTTFDVLLNKLSAGTNITISLVGSAGNRQVQIANSSVIDPMFFNSFYHNVYLSSYTGLTTGVNFGCKRVCKILGAQFRTFKATAHTIRIRLWYGGSSVATVDVSCSGAGQYTGYFASAYSVADNQVGDLFRISMWDTAGGQNYTASATAATWTGGPLDIGKSYFSFDGFPKATSLSGDLEPTSNASSEKYPIDPIIQIDS
jgi:hypothetical protein